MVAAGMHEESLEEIAHVYEVISAGWRSTERQSIKMVAREAAKIIENRQRECNIALSEMSFYDFQYNEYNTYEVLEAQGRIGTFLKFLDAGFCW